MEGSLGGEVIDLPVGSEVTIYRTPRFCRPTSTKPDVVVIAAFARATSEVRNGSPVLEPPVVLCSDGSFSTRSGGRALTGKRRPARNAT